MFLKNLTLKGFKSFADTTSLDLEPGVTVVVGPNGSGKSNVVDAIAWVLGAQAPSSVRSQKMDDVIFAGTSTRPALGRAEVALTIDNSSGMLPLDLNEVMITRTLFRSGESEYAINGVPCRLLDIADLLSDGGIGRQQHVIVSQGQIEAVLNARPEERRAVIEEAAGVLKFRKRKERAERRLTATGSELTRVRDLMRELRRQLRPLEKQAEAARRHGDLVTELEALRLHLAGRELSALRQSLSAAVVARAEQTGRADTTRAELEAITAEVQRAERHLGNQGGHDLGESLARLEAMRERTRGLAAVITERRRGIDRERSVFTDRAVIASFEAEAARCRRDLDAVEGEVAALAPEITRLVEAEARLVADRAHFEHEWGEGPPVPPARAAEARGELGALRAAIDRGESEARRLSARIGDLTSLRHQLETPEEERRAELGVLHHEEEPLVLALETAETARDTARDSLATARSALAQAESEHLAWVARAEALTLALDDARARAGARHLVDVEGVLGTLMELVEIEQGWEAAVEAAVGEALWAVVARDPDSARAALAELAAGEMSASVLALGLARRCSPRPGDGTVLRDQVRGTAPGVDRLLDSLLCSVTVVDGDWSAAAAAAAASPEVLVVTRAGDRFGPTGWRVGSPGTAATVAALEEARARVQATRLDREAAVGACERAETALADQERLIADLGAHLDAIDSGRAAAIEALRRIEADQRDIDTETEALRGRVAELSARADREGQRVTELERSLPRLEAAEAESLDKGRRLARAREEIEERAAAVGALRTDVEVRAAGLEERRLFLRSRLAELEERLQRDTVERDAAQQQRLVLDRHAAVLARLARVVHRRAAITDDRLAGVRARRRRDSEAARAVADGLDRLRRSRSDAEARLEALRSASARAEVGEAELRTRLQGVVERVRAEHGVTTDVAMSAPCPDLDHGVTAEQRARQLESELEIIGPVNPLALEEFQALRERHGFLQGQLDDIRSTRRELGKVIRSVDEEMVAVFASAFADVAMNFEQLFDTLFPGGEGRLRLTDPEELLTTGIEIEARPSGKNVRKLSLLSGGERTLTALAFLFAVFRSRPSPFYVMDEVEAALDDVNLHRFLSLVEEFRADAQLLLVSHQKRTMEAADCLYGVSMRSGGSSRVIAERVSTAA